MYTSTKLNWDVYLNLRILPSHIYCRYKKKYRSYKSRRWDFVNISVLESPKLIGVFFTKGLSVCIKVYSAKEKTTRHIPESSQQKNTSNKPEWMHEMGF